MKMLERKSFQSLDAFRQYAGMIPVLYFYVFEKTPHEPILLALQGCDKNEEVILLDVAEDSGFLAQTPVTVEITVDHRFISKPLSEVGGVHAWAKGTLVAHTRDAAEIPALMQKTRLFAFRGSIADPAFRRHEQGDYEQREELP